METQEIKPSAGWGEPLITLELDMVSWEGIEKHGGGRLPLYYEMWNWEGDTEVLPGKWFDVIKVSYGEHFVLDGCIRPARHLPLLF